MIKPKGTNNLAIAKEGQSLCILVEFLRFVCLVDCLCNLGINDNV